MVQTVVLLVVVALAWWVWRSFGASMRQWRDERAGAPEPAAKPLPSVPGMDMDTSKLQWQVTSQRHGDAAKVAVAHPKEGSWHEWDINLRGPYAQTQLDSAISSAESLCQHLNGDGAQAQRGAS